jgi:hypothetical protein
MTALSPKRQTDHLLEEIRIRVARTPPPRALMQERRRIAVAGATGRVGHHVVDVLEIEPARAP